MRRQRISVREKLVTAWKSLSYTKTGQDPAKLFSRFDKDKNGLIDELEFRNAVRKGGQITASMMPDSSVLQLFHAVDTDGSGGVTVDELESFLWGTNADVALDTPTASPRSSRLSDRSFSPLIATSPDSTFAPPQIYKSAMQQQQQQHVPALPMLVVPTKEARDALFNALDANRNGGLSLAEIDKGVVSGAFTKVLSPEGSTGGESFDHKPALMRAYHAADRSKDGFIERSEFAVLLHYMVYFNNMWHKFEAIDSDHDRRLDLAEFTAGCEVLGLEISAEEAEVEFARCDADGGGMILFGEFCAWCAARHVDSTEPES